MFAVLDELLAKHKYNVILQAMKSRMYSKIIVEQLRHYPAVALIGARQCGKTTLAKSLEGEYFDLEDEGDILKLDLSWDRLVAGSALVILDEAQAHPPVFKRLRSAIDRRRDVNGRFLLLGSVAPALMREISQSLAGRLALVEISPFFLSELGEEYLDKLWLAGGFPDGGVLSDQSPGNWQRNYLSLLAQRDLPNWGLPSRPQVTERLFRMLAASHGSLWNASMIGKSLGLNYQTVNSYMEYLKGAFLVRQIQPYHANLKKRLVKSPKTYWRDSGLLHALLGITSMDDLLSQPWVGFSWEGFVIQQALACLDSTGIGYTPYFLRTSDQHEIDLLLDLGSELWACEIKLSSNPDSDAMTRLNRVADLVGAKQRIIISRTTRSFANESNASLNLPDFLYKIRKFLCDEVQS